MNNKSINQMLTKYTIIVSFLLATMFSSLVLTAQNDKTGEQAGINAELKTEIASLKMDIENLRRETNNQGMEFKNKIGGYTPVGLVLFLFGALCALWAQDTGRNAWVWFFFGFILSVLAIIIMLVRNAEDINSED